MRTDLWYNLSVSIFREGKTVMEDSSDGGGKLLFSNLFSKRREIITEIIKRYRSRCR